MSVEVRHGEHCPARDDASKRCRRRGCSWRAAVYPPGGGRVRSDRFPTRDEAEAWEAKQREKIASGQLIAPSVLTLSEAWSRWLDRARAGELASRSDRPYKPSTLRDYDEAIRKRVLPELGSERFAKVTQASLKRLVAKLRADGLAGSTIHNAINPLRALYRDADLIAETAPPNPTDGLRLPASNGRRERIAEPQHAAALIAAVPKRDRALWAMAFYAGLRRGELRAMRWGDLDLDAGAIRVERSWGREAEPGDPKSAAGRRSVPILAELRRYLEAHRDEAGEPAPEALVFATSTGRPFDGPTVSERAGKAWERADLEPFTLHEARHTFASLLIAAGANAKTIQTWMGHSSVATTFDLYGKLMRGSEDEAVELVDDYLARALSVGRVVGRARQPHRRFLASTGVVGDTTDGSTEAPDLAA